jgi:predicted 2-oxoglutarate/Fe(II)-dependent dioxygenase YbiX
MKKSAWQEYKEKKAKNFVVNNRPLKKSNFLKNQIAPGIWIYKNVFENPKQLIENLNESFGDSWTDGAILSNENTSKIDKGSRNCSVLTISSKNLDLHNYVEEKMLECLDDYCLEYNISNQFLNDQWQMLRYGNGQKFDNHADDSPMSPRDISMTAYLNNDYKGGELEYENFGLSFCPEPGDVLVFPSSFVYTHRVAPVISGVRYALVNWFSWNIKENVGLNK